MSRKTRQEKIIADLRRRLEATKKMKWEARSERIDNEVRSKKKETEISHLPSPSPVSHLLPLTQISLIKKDLIKTGILTILAISLELVLYFLFRVGKI